MGELMKRMNDYAVQNEAICRKNDHIDPRLYEEFGVNRGLRDENGKGVLTGLTKISRIVSSCVKDGEKVPCDGELWYRGYKVEKLIGNLGEEQLGFEKIAYLLLMGELPSEDEEKKFREVIGTCRTLPTNFTRDVIMKAPSEDIMNSMTRSILTLAAYDKKAKDISVSNSLRQCIQLISEFPLLAVYAYHAYNHYEKNQSMYIHNPDPKLSTAENLLMMLRHDQKYTPVEAKVLDTSLILHMEHGGANKKVVEMMDNIRENVKDFSDKEEISAYLMKIIDKQVFDKKGLIYGMGHAVYTLSDPRERVFKKYVEALAREKGRESDLQLYENVEVIAPKLIAENRNTIKRVSPNVDFYSGFVYDMLGIPRELYTAIFAVARVVGWSAHRMEELICTDKIIRPAYMSVMEEKEKC